MLKHTTLFFKTTVSLFVAVAGSALALDGNFYLDGQVGLARGDVGASEMNARMAELGYSAQARVSGQNRTAWKILGGYQYSDYLAVEAGYLDLGEVRTRLSGSPVDIADYLNSANLVHPRSASGYEIALVGRYPFDEKNSVYVRGGLLFASSRYQADAQTDFAKRSSSDRDGFIGVGYGYEINDRWGLHLSAENYRVENENIQLIGVGLKYKFPSRKNALAVLPEPVTTAPFAAENPLPAASNPCLESNPSISCKPEIQAVRSIKLAVLFDTNSDLVKANYMSDIRKLAEFMKEHAGTKVTIEGHTDDQGDARLNKALSQRRAAGVKNILVEQLSIASERVAFVGYGEERPIENNATVDGREINRRVMAEIK